MSSGEISESTGSKKWICFSLWPKTSKFF